MDANTISLMTAGGMLLFLAIQGYRSYQARNEARDKAEATVDQRAVALINAAVKPFTELFSRLDAMVVAERSAKDKAEDARDKAVQDLVRFMERMQGHLDDKVEKATVRIHDRLDACEREHKETKALLIAATERVGALETRERETLRNTPAPGQAVVLMPGQTVIGPNAP